jgi:hypothetical protein
LLVHCCVLHCPAFIVNLFEFACKAHTTFMEISISQISLGH